MIASLEDAVDVVVQIRWHSCGENHSNFSPLPFYGISKRVQARIRGQLRGVLLL